MSEPERKKRTWIWVVVGLLVAAVVLFGAFVGIVVMTVLRDMTVERPAAAEGERAIEDQRQRFTAAPLLEIDEGGITRREELDRRIASYKGAPPTAMRVMAWDDGEGKLVRLSIPFWVLRFSSSRNVEVDIEGLRLRSIEVSAEDLERAGPALVLDHTHRGARVLVWTE
jgi:hypothetical protein